MSLYCIGYNYYMKKEEIKLAHPIEVKNFKKKFGRFVSTDNVSFNLNKGTIHGFIGPNGAGKTTTIKTLIGAYKATSGELLINGHKAGSIKANAVIGYIPERASFPKYMSTIDYLITMARLSGLKKKDAKSKSIKILKGLGLYEQRKRKPFSFSSGMQKKILLAQALITDPEILILDEPAANLDPTARKELFDSLVDLRNQGKTILISSHILQELERIIDEVTFIYSGEILFSGKTSIFNKSVDKVFIQTSDNKALIKLLKTKKIKHEGALNNEIALLSPSKKVVKDLTSTLLKKDIEIISLRTNDLQTAYENLLLSANKNNKGNQSLNGKKITSKKEMK